MSFNGTLVKIGDYEIPKGYIKANSYKAYPRKRVVKKKYTDANGVEHVTAYAHTRTKIEFSLRDMLNSEWQSIIAGIKENYLNENERRVSCEYYDLDSDSYVTGTFRLQDYDITVMTNTDTDIRLNPIKLILEER